MSESFSTSLPPAQPEPSASRKLLSAASGCRTGPSPLSCHPFSLAFLPSRAGQTRYPCPVHTHAPQPSVYSSSEMPRPLTRASLATLSSSRIPARGPPCAPAPGATAQVPLAPGCSLGAPSPFTLCFLPFRRQLTPFAPSFFLLSLQPLSLLPYCLSPPLFPGPSSPRPLLAFPVAPLRVPSPAQGLAQPGAGHVCPRGARGPSPHRKQAGRASSALSERGLSLPKSLPSEARSPADCTFSFACPKSVKVTGKSGERNLNHLVQLSE